MSFIRAPNSPFLCIGEVRRRQKVSIQNPKHPCESYSVWGKLIWDRVEKETQQTIVAEKESSSTHVGILPVIRKCPVSPLLSLLTRRHGGHCGVINGKIQTSSSAINKNVPEEKAKEKEHRMGWSSHGEFLPFLGFPHPGTKPFHFLAKTPEAWQHYSQQPISRNNPNDH